MTEKNSNQKQPSKIDQEYANVCAEIGNLTLQKEFLEQRLDQLRARANELTQQKRGIQTGNISLDPSKLKDGSDTKTAQG